MLLLPSGTFPELLPGVLAANTAGARDDYAACRSERSTANELAPPGAICNVPSPLKTPPERMAFPTKDWEATASGDANGFTHAASRYPQREGLQQLEGGETASPRGSRGTAFSGLPCSRLRPPPCITRRRGKLRVMQTVPRDFGIRGRNASSLRKGSGVEVLCSRDQRWRLASLVSRSRQSSGLSKTST